MEETTRAYIAGFLDGDGSIVLQLNDVRDKEAPSPEEFLEWARRVESYQALNYSKRSRCKAEDVERFLSSKGWLPPP